MAMSAGESEAATSASTGFAAPRASNKAARGVTKNASKPTLEGKSQAA